MFLTSVLSMIFMKSELSMIIIISSLLGGFFFQNSLMEVGTNMDKMSWSMIILSLFVSSLVLSSSYKSKSMPPVVIFSMLIVVLFFLTDNLIIFFIMFEMSLIPLMILLLSWGRNAERLNATQFMLIYTIIGSAPLLFLCMFLSLSSPSLYMNSISLQSESILLFLSLVAFFVKIPVFLFHSWLPKAHVEAPLEGSMILAGIMLKVGVYGLIRILSISSVQKPLVDMIFCISLIGSIMSGVFALSSDDMKMSVAFSSVSHMNMVSAALLSMKSSGEESSIIIMISHGICSPLLFYLVTKIYSSSNSRSILLSKGVYSNIPFLWLVGLVLWSINLSVPPFFSFMGELLGFSAVMSSFEGGIIWVGGFLVISSFYSIVNFGMQSHSSFKLPFKGELESKDYMFSLFSIIVSVLSVLIFFFPLL